MWNQTGNANAREAVHALPYRNWGKYSQIVLELREVFPAVWEIDLRYFSTSLTVTK